MTAQAVTILGAGSWGTALALLLADNGHDVKLWEFDSDLVEKLLSERTNQRYLPGRTFPDNLAVVRDIKEALADATNVFVVVPSHAFRSIIESIKPYFTEQMRLIWGTKGLDESGELLHKIAMDELGDVPMAVISGPSFASEVAKNLPTAVTVAADDPEFAKQLAALLSSKTFRVYTNTDLIGVQLCGAVKNVLAIAVGVSDGLGFGANTRCALITRGLVEMTRLGIALGGEQQTFMGLAGVGDLVLTCTDNQSRNRRFGLAVGAGQEFAQIQKDIGQVVEGVYNVEQVYLLAKKYKIDMPICQQVYKVLHKKNTPEVAVKALLNRDLKPESIS